MPLPLEDYETLLNELNNPELEHSRRTELLQTLRTDYTTVHTDFNQLTESETKLKKDKDDLVLANSQLFRQVGITGNPDLEKKEEQKTFSETVTLESLEK